jgi:hypothetical protein
MQSLIKILKVNEPRKGISSKTNKPWEMQDAECLLMNDDGSVGSVGVLQLPKALMGTNLPAVGDYTAKFTLQSGMTDRKINAVLVGLTPIGKPAVKVS